MNHLLDARNAVDEGGVSGLECIIEQLRLYAIKLDGRSDSILFLIFPMLSARDRHTVLSLVE